MATWVYRMWQSLHLHRHPDLTEKTRQNALDVESQFNRVDGMDLVNDLIHSFAWSGLSVVVKSRKTKKMISILTKSNGIILGGEMLAIMGPSGSGKTTLLNALAHRVAAAGATTSGDIRANGQHVSLEQIRQFSSYVEQEDSLIGSLTVRETMLFAAGLSLSSNTDKAERNKRVDDLISSFGLKDQADTIVGTPIKKGLSGGQKKRLEVATSLVTAPQILFLDEPTSGLDSTMSYEVMAHLKDVARRHNLIVIASIHQPSTTTFNLFDKLYLVSKGKTCFFGPRGSAVAYFAHQGHQMPMETNPAEFLLDIINTDLAREGNDMVARVNHLTEAWNESSAAISSGIIQPEAPDLSMIKAIKPSPWVIPWVLLQRSWIKAYRDIVTYWIRVIMYLGLAILMGTVFLRLDSTQKDIQPFINALFFGSAFMSFMAVAYVPAFLEDLHTFRKERANGLVGPLAFSAANFLIGLPFLFLIALIFSLVAYFLIGFRQDAGAFFYFLLWLFLDLVAAESLVVLVSVIFPVFVVALAVTAFANGLWMCVDGFLVPIGTLNVFWKYVTHYIDYQAYVFQGMMVNEFRHRVYSCAKPEPGVFQCMYPGDLVSVGKIRGEDVLRAFDIGTMGTSHWLAYTVVIIVGYRLLALIVLLLRKH
ncbi:hypothetical protein LTR56_000496 [Elasticomyces elasticus]|nr:hypothetical protein LTR22_014224 [Elasticomyces elasticus]KAK3660738.1 hypothetical protein LTR56_000496 [Elasticomyces elasticus]KAK4922884.1 hypothetical protein LTR49_009891 [Elasticomyces elasticus]KAK5759740.1 hypothetical protein LTS12_010080 [Elasticomyces elasticus]